MKKIFLPILSLLLLCLALSGCESSKNPPVTTPPVTTTAPCTEHLFGDWQTLTAASCKASGRSMRTCSICAFSEERIDPKNDSHTPVKIEGEAPTCGKSGMSEGSRCSACYAILVAPSKIPATGEHTTVVDSAVDPSCKKVGLTEGSHCAVCKTVFVAQEQIPSPPHQFVDYRCTVCGSADASEGLVFEKIYSGYALKSLGSFRGSTLVIPETYNGLPVTQIRDNAVYLPDSRITRIIIPDSVNTIYSTAFFLPHYCVVELGGGMRIDKGAFYFYGGGEIVCRTDTEYPSNILHDNTPSGSIPNEFQITPQTISKNGNFATEYTEQGFGFVCADGIWYLCDYRGSERDLTLPADHNGQSYRIAPYAFTDLDVDRIVLSAGVTQIGIGAFSYSSLSEIDLTSSATVLPESALSGCKIKELVIPDNFTKLESTSLNTLKLDLLVIGRGILEIENDLSTSGISKLYFNAVACESVGMRSFWGCENVIIGRDVEQLPRGFMNQNSFLASLSFESGGSLRAIGAYAFAKFPLASIEIPATVEMIDRHAFGSIANCENLREIRFAGDAAAWEALASSGFLEGISEKVEIKFNVSQEGK